MLTLLIVLYFFFTSVQCVQDELSDNTAKEPTIPLDAYSSHQEFFSIMQQLLEKKVQIATLYIIRSSKVKPDQLLSNIDSNQYLFLQLLYSLGSGDVAFSNQLLELATSSFTQSDVLNDFVRSNLKIPPDKMYPVIRSIVNAKILGLSEIPKIILKEILLMTNKSEILLVACEKGDIIIVEWILKMDNDIDLNHPLEIAWVNEKWDIVKILIRNGALKNVNIQNKFNNNPNASLIQQAAASDAPEAVALLLKAGAPIDSIDENGATPLYTAIANNNIATANIFAENGANVSPKTKSGNTALHAAASNGNSNAVKLLLSMGASIHEKNNLGLTPLHIADQSGIFYIIQRLLHLNIKLPNKVTSDHDVLPYMYFLSEYEKSLKEPDDHQTENYCEIAQLMIGRANFVPFQKELKTKLLELVVQNKIPSLTQCLINLGSEISVTNKNNETLLFNAVRVGSYDLVRLLLNEGVDVDARNINGETAVIVAAANGILDIVSLLLKRGADINAVSNDGFTALHAAAKGGHGVVIDYLVIKGANVDAVPSYHDDNDTIRETPLQLAASHGHFNVVKYFLRKGIFDDIKTNETWTALHAAAKAGHDEIVNYLLDKGYSINVSDWHGKSPLWWAASGGNVPTLLSLIERGADVYTRSNHQSTGNRFAIIFKSFETPLHIAALNGHKEVCKILLDKGINKDVRDAVGETPLYNAALRGHYNVTKFLIERRVNKNAQTINGTTALHAAASEGHLDVVDLLIDKGMDIDVKNNQYMTPLFSAAKAGRVASVKHLIDKLAEINAVSAFGTSPLTAAVRGCHLDVILLLLDNGANIEITDNKGNSLLMDAVSLGYTDVAKLLLKRGAYVNSKSKRNDGLTVLHIAMRGDVKMIDLLMEANAFVNEEAADGTIPLFEAVTLNNIGAVNSLFVRNMNTNNTRKGDKWSCLHMAVVRNSLPIVQKLLDREAYINALNADKDTPLHFAVNLDSYDIARLLLERGADINIKNDQGETPFHIAKRENYKNILNLRLCDCESK